MSAFEQIVIPDPGARGLITSPHVGLLPPNASTVQVNCHHLNGGIRKRFGRTLLGSAISTHVRCDWFGRYSLNSGSSYLVQVRSNGSGGDGYLYKFDSTWKGFISGSATATSADKIAPVVTESAVVPGLCTGVAFADDLYIANGNTTATYCVRDGAAIERVGWGGGTLTTGTNGAASAGGSLTIDKDYSWVWTLYDPLFGAESNPSPASAAFQVTGATDFTKAITMPALAAWDDRFTKIRIYRTRAGGATYFFEKEISISGDFTSVAQTSTLSVADDNLGSEVEDDNDPPPRLQFLTIWDGRMWAFVPGTNATIAWSKNGNPQAWPSNNQLDLDGEVGDDITALFEDHGSLYVVKRNEGIFVIEAAGSTYVYRRIAEGVGCASHWSVCKTEDGEVVWVSNAGWMRFNGGQPRNISRDLIRPTIESWGTSFYDAVACLEPGTGWVRTVHTTSTNIRGYTMCNTRLDPVESFWLESMASATAGNTERYVFADRTGVYAGDVGGRTFTLNTGFTDNGVAISMDWATPWFGPGDGSERVLIRHVFFERLRADTGASVGSFTMLWEKDTSTGSPGSQVFNFIDDGTTGPLSKPNHMSCGAAWNNRIRLRATQTTTNVDLNLGKFTIKYKRTGSQRMPT